MGEMTIDDLIEVLNNSMGDQDPIAPAGDPADVKFIELGYDSLTMLNALQRIERRFRIDLGETVVSEAETPRQLVDRVNTALA